MRGARVFGGVLVIAMIAGCPARPGETITEASTGVSTGPTTETSGPTTSGSNTESTGAPTTGGAEAMRCVSRCDSDRDCLREGMDQGFRCLDGLCAVPACTSDGACLAAFSGWTQSCAAQEGCAMTEACVDVDGAGRCALVPGTFQCSDFGLVELMWPTIEGDTATVCGQETAVCQAGECFTPCSEASPCAPQSGHPFCNPETKDCECQVDQDCLDSQLAGFTKCVAGRCACATDADCAGGKNVDTCFAGACGCSSDAVCTEQVFDGETLACQ